MTTILGLAAMLLAALLSPAGPVDLGALEQDLARAPAPHPGRGGGDADRG